MAPVPGSPWKCVSRMTSLPPSPHTHTHTIICHLHLTASAHLGCQHLSSSNVLVFAQRACLLECHTCAVIHIV